MDGLSKTILDAFNTSGQLADELIFVQEKLKGQDKPLAEVKQSLQHALDLVTKHHSVMAALIAIMEEDKQLAMSIKDVLADAATREHPKNQAVIMAVRLQNIPMETFREALPYLKPVRRAKLLEALKSNVESD